MDDGGKFTKKLVDLSFAEPMNVDMLGTLQDILLFQKERGRADKDETSLRDLPQQSVVWPIFGPFLLRSPAIKTEIQRWGVRSGLHRGVFCDVCCFVSVIPRFHRDYLADGVRGSVLMSGR
jgi:hypothetical protein